jgi:hypothetical protein
MHPIHVSVTNMEIQAESNTVLLSFKVFTDDFQLLLNQLYNIDLDLSKNGNYNLHKDKVDAYFQNNFKVLVKDKELKFTSDSIKTNDEAIWFFYNIVSEDELNTFIIKNSIMLDLYPDQKNLLLFKKGKLESGYRFTFKKKEFTINANEY